MKKILLLSLSLVCLICLAISFSACEPHFHDYTAIETVQPTCTEKGYTTYTCKCGDSYADDYVDELGHDLIHHDGKKATAKEVGYKAYDTCSRCDYTTYEEVPYVGISFKTIEIEDNCGYITLPNATESFKFTDEIVIHGNATYVVSKDEYGFNTIVTKTTPLKEGDNLIYIIETIEDEVTNVYKITVRRKPTYAVSFKADNGQTIPTLYIEEGECVKQSEVSIYPGYVGVFDYDFAKPITSDIEISVKVQTSPEMENFIFTSTENTCTITGLKNKTISSLIIPDCVTTISYYALTSLDLESITIPDSVISIYLDAFHDTFIKKATIPASACADIKNDKLTTVIITSGDTIASDAFYNCSSLQSVTIPDSVTSIGENAFYGCENLTTVYNYSDLDITCGSTDNGYVGYYLKEIDDPFDISSVALRKKNGIPYLVVTTEYKHDGTAYVYLYEGNEEISLKGETVESNKGETTTLPLDLRRLAKAKTKDNNSFEGKWMDIRINFSIHGVSYATKVAVIDTDSIVAEIGSMVHDDENVYKLHYYVRNNQVELKVFFRPYQYSYSIDAKEVDGIPSLVIEGQLADSLSDDFAKLANGKVSIGNWNLEGTIAADGSWKIVAPLNDIEMNATVAGIISFESADGKYTLKVTANDGKLDIAACENVWTFNDEYSNPRCYSTTTIVGSYVVTYGSDWNEPFLKVEYLGTKLTFDKLELAKENDKPYAVFSGTYGFGFTSSKLLESAFLEIAKTENGFDFQQYNTWTKLFDCTEFKNGLPDEITIVYNNDGTFQIEVDLSEFSDTNGWYLHVNGSDYNAQEWTKGQSIEVGGKKYTLGTGEDSGNMWASSTMTIWVEDIEWKLTFDKFELVADNNVPYAVFTGTYGPGYTSENVLKAALLEIAKVKDGFDFQQYNGSWPRLFNTTDADTVAAFESGFPTTVVVVYNNDGTFQIKVNISELTTADGWYIHVNNKNFTADKWTEGQTITAAGKTYTLGKGTLSWATSLMTIWVADVQ